MVNARETIPPKERHWRGFTMVELLATLLISALLSTAIAVAMTTTIGSASLADVRSGIEHLDHNARREAVRLGTTLTLRIDRSSGSIELRNDRAVLDVIRLPRRITITDVWVQEVARTAGSFDLVVAANGTTPTYGLAIRDRSGEELHLLVVGGTGQVIEMSSRLDVEEVIDAIPRLHID